MSTEQEIRQLFDELKAVDQARSPDFETTFRAAVKRRSDRLWYLRRAAAIAVVVAVSFGLLWFSPGSMQEDLTANSIMHWNSPADQSPLYPDLYGQSISNWQSPTQFTMGTNGVNSNEISNWKSPTDFLLNSTEGVVKR